LDLIRHYTCQFFGEDTDDPFITADNVRKSKKFADRGRQKSASNTSAKNAGVKAGTGMAIGTQLESSWQEYEWVQQRCTSADSDTRTVKRPLIKAGSKVSIGGEDHLQPGILELVVLKCGEISLSSESVRRMVLLCTHDKIKIPLAQKLVLIPVSAVRLSSKTAQKLPITTTDQAVVSKFLENKKKCFPQPQVKRIINKFQKALDAQLTIGGKKQRNAKVKPENDIAQTAGHTQQQDKALEKALQEQDKALKKALQEQEELKLEKQQYQDQLEQRMKDQIASQEQIHQLQMEAAVTKANMDMQSERIEAAVSKAKLDKQSVEIEAAVSKAKLDMQSVQIEAAVAKALLDKETNFRKQ
jgi:hypothetical protein